MEQQKALRAVMICLLLIAMAVVGRETAVYVETVNAVSVLKEERHTPGEESPVVVIDAGHGGDDPGKIGINGSLEGDGEREKGLVALHCQAVGVGVE